MSVGYATFSSGASRDPRACRGIWKRCRLALGALDLGWLSRNSAAIGVPPWGKQGAGDVYKRQEVRGTINEADELDDAGTADLFTEISRGIDKWLWFVEAHSQAPK